MNGIQTLRIGLVITTRILLVLTGAFILLLCMVADPLGIGSSPGFGWKQIMGAAAGSILIVLGFALPTKQI
jgi:hypothetical protein